jgi:hypothetical protein
MFVPFVDHLILRHSIREALTFCLGWTRTSTWIDEAYSVSTSQKIPTYILSIWPFNKRRIDLNQYARSPIRLTSGSADRTLFEPFRLCLSLYLQDFAAQCVEFLFKSWLGERVATIS